MATQRVNGKMWTAASSGSRHHRSADDGEHTTDGEQGASTPRQRAKSAIQSSKSPCTTSPMPARTTPDVDWRASRTPESMWFQEILADLSDMALIIMQTLNQFPRELLEPSREQFAACSVYVPAPTLSSINTALKIISWISRNVSGFLSVPRGIGDTREMFDFGDLLQSVGDMLSGMAAQRKVELVIYHGDDSLHEQGQQAVKAVEFNPVYVKGNQSALTYILANIVRQTLTIAHPGDSIELGLFILPSQRTDLLDTGLEDSHPTRCIIDIAHKFVGREIRKAPNLETTLLQRLLRNVEGELILNSLFRPQCAMGRSCELAFTLEPAAPPIVDMPPSIIHGVADQPLVSHEPSFEQLAQFANDLKDQRLAVTIYTKELSTEPMLASLSSWGVDLAVVGNGESVVTRVPEKTLKGERTFIFIDDDIDILKTQIQAANPIPTKRPVIHRVQSSNHVSPRSNAAPAPSVAIVYFSSLDNFKFIRETVRLAVGPIPALGPEVIVVPKPVGPRRLLTILYTAFTKPRANPSVFSPNLTSPGANGTLISTSPSTELPKPGSPRPPPGTRSNSDRSVRSSAVKENLPISPQSPVISDYFPAKASNNPLTGIRIQDSDGSVQGIYFNPKAKSHPSSPAQVPPIPLVDTFASMQELARFLPQESQPATETPLERIYHSRRNTTPQGSNVAPRLGPEHNVVPPIRVLVVDDNRISRDICRQALRKIGVASDLAVNGQDALDKWRTGKFHMILMDIQMPIMDGLKATMQIRREEKMMALAGFPRGTPLGEAPFIQRERTPSDGGTTPYPSSVVIVALTASREEEDRVQALAAGCNDFLTKPVSTIWLHNKVTEWGSIKALQQWAHAEAPDNLEQSQIERANRVASGLVPPMERRTPSPGQSKQRQPVSVASPPVSGAATSATSWGTEPSPMTFHSNLGVPTPVTGGFSPRGASTSGHGQALDSIDELESMHVEDHETDDDSGDDGDLLASAHEQPPPVRHNADESEH